MLLGKPREVYDWLVWVMCPFCPPIIVARGSCSLIGLLYSHDPL